MWLVTCLLAGGCALHLSTPEPVWTEERDSSATCYDEVAAGVEYPDVERRGLTEELDSLPPRLLADGPPQEFQDISLAEAIRISLNDAKVLKDLGGRVLQSPQSTATVFDPSIIISHPRLGEEAALASFDAHLANRFAFSNGSQIFNNAILGQGAFQLNQGLFQWDSQLTKTAIAGTQFSVRHQVLYDDNNSPLNVLPTSWNGFWEASVRQPLLQGNGVLFNRIAGPHATPDLNLLPGPMLARINGDIAITDFERAVQNHVVEVEVAYWQLYLAYRTLDANCKARDSAKETWLSVKARNEADLRGGEADSESQAREQYLQFEQLVISSLNGTLPDGTPGVYASERRLRRMLGLPITGQALLRPSDEPVDVPVSFDWHACLADALTRRVELRQQMWVVRQRELELVAAKNFLLPRLDAVAAYTLQGFGKDLIGGSAPLSSLAREITSFQNDTVSAGLQLNVPLGYRKEIAGVRHSELNLCRARAVLHDQEHQVSFDLSNALATVETTYENIGLSDKRLQAGNEVVSARRAVVETGQGSVFELLDAQRRLVEAEIGYFRARVAYVRDLTNVHLQKGTLLEYNGVSIFEGNWCPVAYQQLPEELAHWRTRHIDYRIQKPRVSLGTFDPAIDGSGSLESSPGKPAEVERDTNIQDPFELNPPANDDPIHDSDRTQLDRLPSVTREVMTPTLATPPTPAGLTPATGVVQLPPVRP